MLRNGLEPWHIILVVLVCILVFGSKKLPDAARGIGKSMRILKSEARAMKSDDAQAPPSQSRPEVQSPAQEPVEPTKVEQPHHQTQ